MKLMMMIVLLLLDSQHALGVEVYEGAESVLLFCQVPADVSRSSTSAVWGRDEFKEATVHLRLKSGDNLKDQNHRYSNRTSMRVDALQTGDLSLTLKKPTVSDSGTYTCTALKAGEPQIWTEVHLKVTEPPPVWPKVLAAVLVALIILAAVFGLFVCCAYKRMKDGEVPQPEEVEVYQQEPVVLPFKTTANLPRGVTVEWTRSDSENRKVHVYENGKDQPEKQDQGYRGRTEMDEDPLRNEDLSLTLKDLLLTDRGVYTCTVYNKDRHMLLQKSVALKVKAPLLEEMGGTQGEECVELPFKPTADLPPDVTVVWRLTVFKHIMVHVYENGKDQRDKQDQGYKDRTEMKKDALRTKDLSLTLKHPIVTDSEDYTCTVYNKDGDKLLHKVVILRITESLPDIVQVTQGEESVKLPFETTADLPHDVTVEWTDPKHMKVHVYASGKDQPDKQHQGYRGRTEMDEDPLRTKDLSLTLKHPIDTDSGVYTCTVYNKDGHIEIQKSVTLSIRVSQTEVVGLTQEKESVDLPFKTTPYFLQDFTVEWTDPKHMKVHVYEDGRDQPDKQHQGYRGRTEMKKDALSTGDLSLTLKHPIVIDSKVYTCTVYNKHGLILLQKSVTLIVRAPWMEIVEVTQREESVRLRFQIPPVLPQDVTVEWTRSDCKEIMVHLYESGKDQPDKQHQGYRGRTEMKKDALSTGDVSLTLKDPRLTDSGVYICIIKKKDGEKLLENSSILRVRATLMGTMAEMLPRCLRYSQRRAQQAQPDQEHGNRSHEDVPLMGVQSA